VNEVPSLVLSSSTVWNNSLNGKIVPMTSGGHKYATAKFVVPLGTERLSTLEPGVWAAKAPEPIFAATAVGVPPLNVTVTTVGLPPPPPPSCLTAGNHHTASSTNHRGKRRNRRMLETCKALPQLVYESARLSMSDACRRVRR